MHFTCLSKVNIGVMLDLEYLLQTNCFFMSNIKMSQNIMTRIVVLKLFNVQ